IPTVPLTHLYDAASTYITARGGSVQLRNSVHSIPPLDSGFRVRTQDAEQYFDYGVLAVPFDAAAKLISDLPGREELTEKISHFATSPITGVHLWFDCQISELPHAVLLERTIQWMFHKSVLLGSHANGDAGTTASYVELVISSSKSLINKSRQEIIDL